MNKTKVTAQYSKTLLYDDARSLLNLRPGNVLTGDGKSDSFPKLPQFVELVTGVEKFPHSIRDAIDSTKPELGEFELLGAAVVAVPERSASVFFNNPGKMLFFPIQSGEFSYIVEHKGIGKINRIGDSVLLIDTESIPVGLFNGNLKEDALFLLASIK